jgi:hypothetical protein
MLSTSLSAFSFASATRRSVDKFEGNDFPAKRRLARSDVLDKFLGTIFGIGGEGSKNPEAKSIRYPNNWLSTPSSAISPSRYLVRTFQLDRTALREQSRLRRPGDYSASEFSMASTLCGQRFSDGIVRTTVCALSI